jgi:hypothetical protein
MGGFPTPIAALMPFNFRGKAGSQNTANKILAN